MNTKKQEIVKSVLIVMLVVIANKRQNDSAILQCKEMGGHAVLSYSMDREHWYLDSCRF